MKYEKTNNVVIKLHSPWSVFGFERDEKSFISIFKYILVLMQ